MEQVVRIAIIAGMAAGLSGCIVPAMAVIGGLATVADTSRHWNDECRIPPGKEAIETAKRLTK